LSCRENESLKPAKENLQDYSYPKATYRKIDHNLVVFSVMAHDGGLHLPAQVGEVHPLARQQAGQAVNTRESGADQVGF